MDIGRPKRLFVLVNPFGGKRCASKIYEAEIKPMLEAAGVDVTMQGFGAQTCIVST
jgi:sphingosine kinase